MEISKKEVAADVPVIVRRAVVVDVEQTIVGVVAIVTTDVEARVRRAEVPVIARGLRTKNTGNAQTVPYKVQRLTARLSAGAAAPSDSPVGEFLEAAADVPVIVRRAAVVDVEQTIAGAVAIVTTDAEARARRAEVPAIARVRCVTTGRGCGDKRREAAVCLDLECGRPAIGRNADRRAAAAVAELGGIQDDVQAVAVVVAAIAPVQHVIPQALDVAVLRPAAIGGAAALGRTSVVRHTVGVAHRLRRAVVAASIADFRLTVPVAKFDDIEQPDSKPHGKIALPDGRAEIVDAGAGRRAGHVRPGAAGAALIGAVAVVSADVHHVPLTVTVASVHVRGADAVALHRAVGDLDAHAPAVLGQLVPKFRDADHRAAGAFALYHARPGLQVVERTAIAACARDIRHRVGKLCRLVGSAPLGGAGAVPACAVDVDVGQLKGVILVLSDLYGGGGGLVAQRGRYRPRASDGQIQLDAAALRHRAGDGLVPALGGDGAARLNRDGQGVVGQGKGLGAAILRLHCLRGHAGAERGGDLPLAVVGQGRRKAAVGGRASYLFVPADCGDGASRFRLHHHPGQYDAAYSRSVRSSAGDGEGLVGLDFDSVDAVAGGFGVCGCAGDGEGGISVDIFFCLFSSRLRSQSVSLYRFEPVFLSTFKPVLYGNLIGAIGTDNDFSIIFQDNTTSRFPCPSSRIVTLSATLSATYRVKIPLSSLSSS